MIKLTKTNEKVNFRDGRQVICGRLVYVTHCGMEVVKYRNDVHPLERSKFSDIHRIGFGMKFYRKTVFDLDTEFSTLKQ